MEPFGCLILGFYAAHYLSWCYVFETNAYEIWEGIMKSLLIERWCCCWNVSAAENKNDEMDKDAGIIYEKLKSFYQNMDFICYGKASEDQTTIEPIEKFIMKVGMNIKSCSSVLGDDIEKVSKASNTNFTKITMIKHLCSVCLLAAGSSLSMPQ